MTTGAIQLLASQPWVERLGWALLHFLWQGALIAALYALARRSASARVRYAIACAALTAMAVAPLATFALRNAGPARDNPYIPNIPLSSTAARIVSASPAPWPALASHARSIDAMPWLVMAWFAGAIVFWARLTGGWIVAARMRSTQVRPAPPEWQQHLDEIRTRIRVSRPVRLLVSALVQVPTVVGWLRPLVLVPVGALAGLPPEHIEALLAHELAHIRRHDYLVNILQSVAESLLFYHPAVWWISNHIRNERELCCDDIAVGISGDAFTYARALADLESARPVHFRAVLAANDGLITHRIARLLGQPRRTARATFRPGTSPATSIAILLTIATVATLGQPTARPEFEAASIRPAPDQGFMRVRPLPGRLTALASVRLLMENAYMLPPFQIAGGPSWIDSERYAIDAKADGAASRAQVLQMLQSLLQDRFQLKFHRETRELPVYVLVAAKSGIRLPAPKEGSCVTAATGGTPDWAGSGTRLQPPGQGPTPLTQCGSVGIMLQPSGARLQGGKVSMSELVRMLSTTLDRPVIDKTGYTDLFDVNLDFAPDATTAALPPPPPDAGNVSLNSNSPSITTALQQQLGLRLESDRGPVEVTVIDRVQRPSAN